MEKILPSGVRLWSENSSLMIGQTGKLFPKNRRCPMGIKLSTTPQIAPSGALGVLSSVTAARKQYETVPDNAFDSILSQLAIELEKAGIPVENRKVLIQRQGWTDKITGQNVITNTIQLTDFGIKNPEGKAKKVRNVLNAVLGWVRKDAKSGTYQFAVPKRDMILEQIEHSERMIKVHQGLLNWMLVCKKVSDQFQASKQADPAEVEG